MSSIKREVSYGMILISFFFITFPSIACRYTIRDIGYSPLNLEAYLLYLETDTLQYRQVVKTFRNLGEVYSADANIRYRLTHNPGHTPEIQIQNSRGRVLGKQGISTPEEVRGFYQQTLFSPLQQILSQQIGNVFAFMVCFCEKDNGRINARVEKTLEQFRKIAPTLDKEVSEEIMKIYIPAEKRPEESLIFTSLGLDPDTPSPVIMILYGRGRLVGEPLVGEEITVDHLLEQLVMLGTDCECGIDLSPLLKRAIPLYWDNRMRQDVADMLGFDVDNPMTTTEMERILSKEPLETGTADPSFAPRVINLDQKLGTTVNKQEDRVTGEGMSKTLRYSLLAGAFLFLLIIAGVIIILKPGC